MEIAVAIYSVLCYTKYNKVILERNICVILSRSNEK